LSGQRWGILGGTFDPPHYGHLVIAQQTREALDLAGVLFMPAAQPPHKPDRVISPAVNRRSMVKLAIKGNPAFSLLTIELDRGGTSYTVDSLEALTGSTPDDRFVLILSVEAARQLPAWREPHRILETGRSCHRAASGLPGTRDELGGKRLSRTSGSLSRRRLAGPWPHGDRHSGAGGNGQVHSVSGAAVGRGLHRPLSAIQVSDD
jgi:cytidyltransferase-like protein